MRIRHLLTVTLSTAMLLLAGCASGASEPEPTRTEAAGSKPAELPETPAGERMRWLHELLERDDDVVTQDLDGVFSDEFTAAVPLDEVVSLLNTNIRPAAPFTLRDYVGDELSASVVFEGAIGEPFTAQLSVTSDGTITGLQLLPELEHEAATSLDEVQERHAALPVSTELFVRVDDDDVVDTDGEARPIGSIFKLWVLLAVVDAIDAGELSWGDELTVTDDIRSLPSGRLQDEPSGTTVTVAEAAELMISISDNTATDLLMTAAGRERVDAAAPESMRPVASTAEMFELLYGGDAEPLAAYEAADAAGRQEILERIDSLTVEVSDVDLMVSMVDAPTWQATPADIVDAYDQLAEDAAAHPEVDAALSANPGVPVEGYDSLWFKGGSLSGAVAGSWRGVLPSGETVTVVVIAWGDTQPVADATVETLLLAGDALELA